MKIQIIRIEEKIVSARLEDGHIIDIDKKWLSEDLAVDEVIDFDVEKIKGQ